MNHSSRRQFFQSLGALALEAISVAAEDLSPAAPAAEREEIMLGTLREFPIGTRRCVHAHGMWIEVSAEAGGLRAWLLLGEGKTPIVLRIGAGGILYALPTRSCGPGEALSLFTGEMMQVD